jgi:RNA polymerase sigma-70 factor (ECF subfamily)
MGTWEASQLAAVEPALMSDESLLERVRAGELGLYGILMRRHHRRLHSVALRILKNPSEAEEIVQEAHLRVLTHLDQFGGRSSFLTYLSRIVVNECLVRMRGRAHSPVLDGAWMETAGSSLLFAARTPDPEAQAIGRELHAVLHAAVEALPARYGTVLRLREIDELSVAEAADRLGISGSCVKTRLHRAVAMLRAEFHKQAAKGRVRPIRPPAEQSGARKRRPLVARPYPVAA